MTDQIKRARQLRRNMTDAEKILWSHLRNRQLANLKFRRQVPLGPFFVDFLCVEQKLIVEVDGGQHSEEADRSRTAWIEARGYRLIRFWIHDVMDNVDGVLETIAKVAAPSSKLR